MFRCLSCLKDYKVNIMKSYNAVDLFCGAGGLSKGFMDAGFNILVGVDNDQAALNTFALNHKGAIALNADLSRQETFDKIKELAGNNEIDVVIAGPPCQGFSVTGPRNFDDPRNKLYLAVLEIVRQYQPKGFIIENVPGMAMMYEGQVRDEIIRRFRSMGYNVDSRILLAADYGVPQMRKRLVFMGVRSDIGEPEFPVPTVSSEKYVTCRDAISDLPSREKELGKEEDTYDKPAQTDYQKKMRGTCTKLYNHVATDHKQFVKDTIALVPEGGNYKDLPAGWGESRTFHEAWTRYDGNKPSKTIDTGHRNHFHYEYNRVPTIRENARLQSFPDDFVFTGTKTQQNRQVGNAVPPLLGYALGQKLLQIISGKKTSSGSIKTIDLFAGCGGLTEGFEQSGHYDVITGVEWDKAPLECLRHRMKTKWGMSDADDRILCFDMQRSKELIEGWKEDPAYGTSEGIQYFVERSGGHVDLIIGGPPCQAYSIAGRVRDEHGMRNDYRNYLFESYLAVVNTYRPKAFLFENVPGLLSARPGDGSFLIADRIREEFLNAGYYLVNDLSNAIIDMTGYGIPQRRSRLIILGINSDYYTEEQAKELLDKFYYTVLPQYKEPLKTVRDAIGDLPSLYPLPDGQIERKDGKKYSHTQNPDPSIQNHEPRFANARDIKTFRLLAEDIESGNNKYTSVESLKDLYTEVTGKTSNVHKFYVLRWDEPSNLIPAHLYKDGLRHIHPDPTQARTITVREAARLQTFPDDFEFISHSNMDYKMIGNAVPPKFAKKLADALFGLIFQEG